MVLAARPVYGGILLFSEPVRAREGSPAAIRNTTIAVMNQRDSLSTCSRTPSASSLYVAPPVVVFGVLRNVPMLTCHPEVRASIYVNSPKDAQEWARALGKSRSETISSGKFC